MIVDIAARDQIKVMINDSRSPIVEPNDGIVEWFPGRLVPEDGCLPLIT